MLLFLGDTSSSLTKSGLMLLDNAHRQAASIPCSIPLVSSFRYLGIQVPPVVTESCRLNVHPLLAQFKDNIYSWNNLKMSLAGKTN